MKVKTTLEGSEALIKKMIELNARVGDMILPAALAGAFLIQTDANGRAPASHINMAVTKKTKTRIEIKIGPDKAHWFYRFFEFGATAHEIKADYLTLVFTGEKGWVFAKKVKHTGMAARPFLRPAMDARREEAVREVSAQFRKGIMELTQ